MVLQSKNDHVVPPGLAVLLLCLMQGVPHVEARFTFELDLQSSTTTGSCDPPIFSITPGCDTYFLFCLRASTSGQSRNIYSCPLGSHGRVDENNVPSTVSISFNSAWLRSFQLYIKAIDDDSPFPHEDLDFIFIDSMWQPHQGYSSSAMVTGDNGRVNVTLRYRVWCQDGYYGQDCNSVCGANEQCYSNGAVECVSGWQSPNTSCNTPICRTGCHPIGGNCSTPFQCECNEGWRGDLCDECIPAAGCSTTAATNVCVSSPCANGGTCTPESDSGSYACHCPPGYTGPTCDTNIDECMEASCPENGTCEDGVNTFRCVCNAGYKGPNCTKTASNGQGPINTTARIILAGSVPSGVLVTVMLLIVMTICVIALRRKRQTLKGGRSSNRAMDADNADTKMNSKSQRNGIPLATPVIPLQSQCPTESTEEYADHVSEGLGPVYYSSVNGGDHMNELLCQYDYIPANVHTVPMETNPAYQHQSNIIPGRRSDAILNKESSTPNDPVSMTTNPAYQSTHFHCKSSDAILNKDLSTANDPVFMATNPAYQSTSFPSRASGAI